jgi:hypothetical protein
VARATQRYTGSCCNWRELRCGPALFTLCWHIEGAPSNLVPKGVPVNNKYGYARRYGGVASANLMN